MKKLSDEDKAVAAVIIIALWCLFTSAAGYPELWTIPFFVIVGLLCLQLILSLIRDIYFAKRRERLYERRYWQNHKAD